MRAERIAQFLPENYRAANRPHSVLGGVLAVMEALHAPAEATLDDIDRFFDPRRAPVEFLPMLAGWLDLDGYLEWSGGRPGSGAPRFAPGMERLRVLITRAADLNQRRGTGAALEDFLATATGCAGFSVEENPSAPGESARPFHIRVHAPKEAARYADLVGRIVEAERPAYATFDIIFGNAAEGDGHG